MDEFTLHKQGLSCGIRSLDYLGTSDTFDGSKSLANGLFYVDRVKHALMSVGMNYPLERILLFAPSFRKASRASRYVRHTVLARYISD